MLRAKHDYNLNFVYALFYVKSVHKCHQKISVLITKRTIVKTGCPLSVRLGSWTGFIIIMMASTEPSWMTRPAVIMNRWLDLFRLLHPLRHAHRVRQSEQCVGISVFVHDGPPWFNCVVVSDILSRPEGNTSNSGCQNVSSSQASRDVDVDMFTDTLGRGGDM